MTYWYTDESLVAALCRLNGVPIPYEMLQRLGDFGYAEILLTMDRYGNRWIAVVSPDKPALPSMEFTRWQAMHKGAHGDDLAAAEFWTRVEQGIYPWCARADRAEEALRIFYDRGLQAFYEAEQAARLGAQKEET